MDSMNTITNPTIPSEILADLEEAARYAASGQRNTEVMRKACERMDETREQLRREIGEVDVAVELVREVRDES
jgi:hypothetical protein